MTTTQQMPVMGYAQPLRSIDAMTMDQKLVQAGKDQERSLKEYDSYIFPGQDYRTAQSCHISDFLRPITKRGRSISVRGIVVGLKRELGVSQVHWADMGAGHGFAQRQLKALLGADTLRTTAVDLLDISLRSDRKEILDWIEKTVPNSTTPQNAPEWIQDNVEWVQIPQKAHLITSIEVMQYLSDPLRAIANWYNLLSDRGFLIISTEHIWSTWIRCTETSREETSLVAEMCQQLKEASIPFRARNELTRCYKEWRIETDRIRCLVIQKKPGTALQVTVDPEKIWVNHHFEKASYYPRSVDGRPIVEVVRSS